MKSGKNLLRSLFIVAIFGSLAWILVHNSYEIDWHHALMHPGLFFLALLICILNVISQFVVWILLANRDKRYFSWSSGYTLHCISYLSRYLPAGKVFQFVTFAHFSQNLEQKVESSVALILSILCGLLAGALIAVLAAGNLVPSLNRWGIWGAALGVLGVTSLLSNAVTQGWIFDILRRKFPELPNAVRVSTKDILLATFNHTVFGWLAEGVSLVLLLQMISPDHPSQSPWEMYGFLLSCNVLSSLGGYLSFIAPAGVGVKEGIFVFFLKIKLGLVPAVFIALMFRFLYLIADVLFVLPLGLRTLTRKWQK